MLPALWHAGVQGVNFQTVDGLRNQVITARHSASGWRVSVQQFAVRAPDGSERVVLTNAGSAARTIGVTSSGTHGAGSLSLLNGRSLSATGGTTLGGRRLSPRTGRLTGTSRVTRVRPNRRGTYAIRVPAHAAAILTLPR